MTKRTTYKNVLALLLACIYIIGSLRVCFPLITYSVNYNYISTVLCENKAKPEMHCNGKCHLKKELKKATEQDSKDNKSLPVSTYNDVTESTPSSVIIICEPSEFLSFQRLGAMYTCIFPLTTQDISTPPPQA